MSYLIPALHYIIPFVIVISVVVFVHEFGHYWVARRCGVRIVSFSLGFGPKLFGWTDKHGTIWQVSLLPLGGYVKMFGDADAASAPDESVKTMTEEEKKVSFHHQPVNKRIAIVAAGPAFNYLFAILVLAVLFTVRGQPFSPPTISSLQENGVAASAGLQAGDKVLKVGGEDVQRFEDIKRIIGMNAGTPVDILYDRAGTTQSVTLTPQVVEQTDRFGGKHHLGRIGIVSDKLDYRKWSPPQALGRAALETWTMTTDTLKAVGQIIMGTRDSGELGGPLRIAQMSGHIAQDGLWALVWFMAVISVNLGLVNIFPIPLLDGGHLMFYSIEKLFGRPLNDKAQEAGMRIGLVLVASLMLFATWNDLVSMNVISKLVSLFS